MNLDAAVKMAVEGSLYPSVILHGGSQESRQEAAVDLARVLLCETPGLDASASCRHCRRLEWPDKDAGFHPDFQVLTRDLRTSTSVDATKGFLKGAQVAPFEAGGQVFVVASSESLSAEAANALLKTLEEPHLTSPRHFFLLAPSQFDLLTTLRSRSLAIYLGTAERLEPETVEPLVGELAQALAGFRESKSSVDLLIAAKALQGASDWKDVRSSSGWTLGATALRELAFADDLESSWRRAILDLAEAMFDGPRLRLRGIPAPRIIDGLVTKHLAGLAS